MPLGHLGLNVADLTAAKAYYDALAPHVGYEPFLADHDQFAYRPVNGKVGTYLFFYPAPRPELDTGDGPGLQHLAFIVATRSAVENACQVAQGLGSDIVHEPRHWPEYPPPYYAGFWHGPDGVLLEAVCHHDRP